MKVFLTLASIACLAGSLALITVKPAAARGKAVAATDVNVVNSPTVKVGNIARIRTVRTPVRGWATLRLNVGESSKGVHPQSPIAPEGSQMVVEGITFVSDSKSLDRMSFFINAEYSSYRAGSLPVPSMVNGHRSGFLPVPIRLSAGERLGFSGTRSVTTETEFVTYHFVGYLEPAP